MRKYHRTLATVLLVLAAGGCATTGGAARNSPGMASESGVIRVENQSVLNLHIYALRGATRVPLGRVETMTSRSFRVPQDFLAAGVQLMAARPGSPRPLVSEPLSLSGGQQVTWHLQDSPNLSGSPTWGVLSFGSAMRHRK